MKTYFIEDAHGPHYEWLMEKTKNLVEYAKREDYKKVAAFCENILEGLRNNKLVDSETKDSVVKDAIQLKDKIDLNALAREIRTKFKTKCVPIKEYNALECEFVWGNDRLDKQIVEYLKSKGIRVEWDSIGDDCCYYLLEDSIRDSKLKDVRLEKGDWFTLRNSRYIYKVVNVSQEYLVCEIYYMYYDYNKKLSLRNEGRKPRRIDNKDLKLNAVRFNSAGEALDWAYRQVKIGNTNKTWKW